MRDQYARWVEEYSPALLKWAYGKTGQQHPAEELAQEVWLQFFSAAAREEREGRSIARPEHLLWKVAHHVWCRSLRGRPLRNTLPLDEGYADPHDFADHLAEEQERARLCAYVHQRIVNLNRLQREAMILYYIEQLPQREIARRLGVTEGALRWHLFETRKKLREGVNDMTKTEFVYRPRKLHMGINGQPVPHTATSRVNENLLMQNILCACYEQGRTIQELSGMLGVACPYIEHDVDWLTWQELLKEEKGRYYTTFLITSAQEEQEQLLVYQAHQATLSDVIIRHLLSHEQDIRQLGFIGSDQPMNRMLWWLIQHFSLFLTRPVQIPERPIRPDGGKYWPLGFDNTDPVENSLRNGWAYNGSMHFARFYWFGLYNFGNSEIEDMLDAYTPEWQIMHTLLENLIAHDFDLSCVPEAGQQYALAQLAEKGFIRMENGKAAPRFTILTQSQYDTLRDKVFLPLTRQLEGEMNRLADDLREAALRKLPKHLHHLSDLALGQSLLDLTYITEILAGTGGHLYLPRDKADGEFLTLVYIKD
ncbi:MAG: RNA polymerase sigma factor [Clostridia bacterium]|nr:RNA polymerase sigma factor [Clostridia bacterium]